MTLEQGATHVVTPDVKIMEGRFTTTTSIAPVKGRYVNTMVRQGKTWLLATVVTIPDPPRAEVDWRCEAGAEPSAELASNC